MADYEVVLSDLRTMSGTFHSEADTYRGLKDKVSPAVAATGDGTLDSILTSVVETLDVLHTQMAKAIEDHGDKLGSAERAYGNREVDVHGVFDDLMKDE